VLDLGFYSDDWWFLNILASAKSQSFIGLARTVLEHENFTVRPVQGLQLSSLYWLFGMNPLGYHIVNALTIALGITLFHLGLNRLKLQRVIAVGVPLVYALLPHYSTTRFWLSSFGANLSILFLFLNLYAGLRYISVKNGSAQKKWLWLFVSSFSTLACILTYELAMPLFSVNLFIFWAEFKRETNPKLRFNVDALLVCNVLLLMGGIAYKFLLSERTGGFVGSYTSHVARVIRATIANDYWTYGVKIPVLMWKILKSYYNSRLLFTAAILSSVSFVYLFKIKGAFLKPHVWLKIVAVGIVVYFGGYAVFLTTKNFQISSTGLSNRIAVAAAIGVAICFVSGAGLLCSFIKNGRVRNAVFSLVLAGLVFCGYIINCTISRFYADSYVQQQAVLDSIYTYVPELNKDNTLILDGMCPYVGPVPVFDCSWDLSGALSLHYKNAIKADVRTQRMSHDAKGITTWIYGKKGFYPYNKDLVIYNFKTKRTYRLSGFEEARTYFSAISPGLDECANGLEGEGLKIF
jgi:hypothetical protein